ncbi:isoprenyl transferase [Virgibacillus soli]|uniref:isoprenyl transferase n=1 Tax=Paracerasibacillus soli TaxID=480284 RepID=UPI0035E5AAFB
MSIRLPFFKRKSSTETKQQYKLKNVPNHVAIIMDGNGRWAKKRGLPRIDGHKEGMDAVQNTVRAATDHGIKILTLFAFSTENWKRPKLEVDYLMRLPKEYLQTYLPELIEKNVRVETIGDFDALPQHTKEAVLDAKERTKDNDGLLLNFAINYGSRHEIVEALKQIVHDVNENKIDVDHINDNILEDYLYTKGLVDPDLLIRTSGEKRLSNFLLWQCAYSEFWFTDVLWPDFNKEVFIQALLDYQNRVRRYGGIK